MIALYRILTRLVYMLVYPYAASKASSGDLLWQGRLGRKLPRENIDVWLHAASVGEVKVLSNLIEYLKTKAPALKLHITTMTRTGYETALSLAGDRVTVSFFPLDAVPAVRRTLDSLKSRMIVVAETEIWPNLIMQASERDTPIVLVNGRMTDKSFRSYRRFSGSLGKLLGRYDRFFFKSEGDRERYARLGVSPDRAEVVGDMKFDAPLKDRSAEEIRELRSRLGISDDQFLFLAGSTRPGEEKLLLELFSQVHRNHPKLRLALAPRHLERIGEIEALVQSAGRSYCKYGDSRECEAIVLIDKMGVLGDLYAAADLAFVGGTLVDIGGHNLLEPVWARTPVVYGPHIGNVAEAAAYIEKHDFGWRVDSEVELAAVLEEVITESRSFVTKGASDLEGSATAAAGKYLIERLNDA